MLDSVKHVTKRYMDLLEQTNRKKKRYVLGRKNNLEKNYLI
jgi:hypothetical protein